MKLQISDEMIYITQTTAAAGAWTELTTSDPTCLASLMPQYPIIEVELSLPKPQVILQTNFTDEIGQLT